MILSYHQCSSRTVFLPDVLTLCLCHELQFLSALIQRTYRIPLLYVMKRREIKCYINKPDLTSLKTNACDMLISIQSATAGHETKGHLMKLAGYGPFLRI